MSTKSLNAFLRDLNVDPGLLATFKRDPEFVLSGSGLSEADREIMRRSDRYRSLKEALADTAPTPNNE